MTDRIETRVAVIEERLNNFDKNLARLDSQLTVLNGNLDNLIKIFNKYQGMGLAAIVALTALWSFITFGIQFLTK